LPQDWRTPSGVGGYIGKSVNISEIFEMNNYVNMAKYDCYLMSIASVKKSGYADLLIAQCFPFDLQLYFFLDGKIT
jgi:hypothetical protein